jgi:lipopolysaccharide transport system permease protein
MNETVKWSVHIKPNRSIWDLKIKEIFNNKDLIFLFVKRDIITVYKQTILGPIWFFLQPVMTMLVYIFIFAKIAGLSTDGIPQPLFYLAGIIIWNYFAECFNQTSNTFNNNANIFEKVYFPRLIIPLSKILSSLIKFIIQYALFISFYIYYIIYDNNITLTSWILITPFLIILMAGLGLGLGLIFSALTTKYRDLKFLISFGVQLVMYSTPIIYPLNSVQGKARTIIEYNPFTHIIEAFKFSYFGQGELSCSGLLYATIFAGVSLLLGLLIFNRTERNFIDTV